MVRSAIVPCVALLALVAAGCSSPDDDGPDEVGTLTGTITGTVLDSSGSPVVGATIRYSGVSGDTSAKADLSTSTNTSGQFVLSGVGVTNVSTIGGNDANGPITLVIESPTSGTPTMGATVEVSPTAQSGGSATDIVFIDNFNVDTGPIRLPRLASTIAGTLRDAGTGAAVADTTLTLDFLGVEFDQDGTTGVASTYDSGGNRVVTSDAAGLFSFTGVYDDSCVRINVENLAIVSLTGSAPSCTSVTDEAVNSSSDDSALYVATTLDGGTTQLANVYVDGFDSDDTIAPTVSSVGGVVDATLDPAPLASRVTGVAPNGLVVNFSEPMQDGIDAADVSVVVGTAPDQYVAELADVRMASSTQLVVELSTVLPAGTPVELLIAREALLDTSGNALVLSEDLAYDSYSNSGTFLDLSLITYAAVDVTSPMVTGVVGVADADSNPGVLDASITGTAENPLVVVFSEPLLSLVDAGDVNVRVGNGNSQTNVGILGVELVAGTQLEIRLETALTAGRNVTIRIDRGVLSDFAGNLVVLNGAIAYDTMGGDDGQTLVLQLATPSS